jgi:hypothetical protein
MFCFQFKNSFGCRNAFISIGQHLGIPIFQSSQSYEYIRPTVIRTVCLGARHPSETPEQFFSFFKIIFRQLQFCWCWAPSLTRCRVCSLQLLLDLASAVILGSESRAELNHIFLSQIRDSQTWRARSSYLYPPGITWSSIPSGTGFPFRRLLGIAGYSGNIRKASTRDRP